MTASFIKPKMKYYLVARTTNPYFKVLKFLRQAILHCIEIVKKGQGKAVLLQAWTGPEGS